MATQIINNGASLKIISEGISRNIIKSQIREIGIINDTIVKIDIGQGALNNVFINHSEVSDPQAATPAALVDAINGMLQQNLSGYATEQNQQQEITQMQNIKTDITDIKEKISSMNDKLLQEPLLEIGRAHV